MFRLTKLRAATALLVLGAMSLAGCGGGGSSRSVGPLPAAAGNLPSGSSQTMGYLTLTLPNKTSPQATNRAILSAAKKPAYLDTSTANSAVVVSVVPQNAAEAAQYGTLTVCYNLYTNGALAPSNPPNFVTTNLPATNDGTLPAGSTVTVGIPAPPGTDGFQITQYGGQCGSTPYTLPTTAPGVNGGILAQTPLTYAYMVPGVANNLNAQIANCPAPAGTPPTVTCPQTVGAGGVPLTANAFISNIGFGPIPIPSPVREQGAFLVGLGKIGVPIPLEGLNGAGTVIPGTPLLGAGPFASGVTVTATENGSTSGPHTALYLVDATNGAIAQQAASLAGGLSIHEFNSLSDGTPATGSVPNDITFGGSTAVGGHPWVIVLTYDGVNASLFTSVTVTATATISGATVTATTTIAPQSAVYSAGTPPNGYPDAANPTAAVGLTQLGARTYITDGNQLKVDNNAVFSAPTGTKLTGVTSAGWPGPVAPAISFIYATDQGQAGNGTGGAAEVPSGVYAFNPVTLAATPVAAQAGSGNWLTFNHPVAVVQAQGPVAGKYYLYVIDAAGSIWKLDIANNGAVDGMGNQLATNVFPPIAVTAGTVLNVGTATYLGAAALAGGQFIIGDPGNNRIAMVDPTPTNGQQPGNAAITAYSTGAPMTGLTMTAAGAVYATSTTGQIYYVSASGAAPVSLGLATGGAVDGPVGQIPTFTPATTPTLTPAPYLIQFQAGSFFSAAGATTGLGLPYTLAPFNGTQAFQAAPAAAIGLIANTSVGVASNPAVAGKINATAGIFVVLPTAGATNITTPNSLEFTDTGKLRTLVQ